MIADKPPWAGKGGPPEVMKMGGDKVAGSGWKAAPLPGMAALRD